MQWASSTFGENLSLVVLEYIFIVFVAAAVDPTQKIHKESFGASSASLADGLWGNSSAMELRVARTLLFVQCFSLKFLNYFKMDRGFKTRNASQCLDCGRYRQMKTLGF